MAPQVVLQLGDRRHLEGTQLPATGVEPEARYRLALLAPVLLGVVVDVPEIPGGLHDLGLGPGLVAALPRAEEGRRQLGNEISLLVVQLRMTDHLITLKCLQVNYSTK